jgi:hypothetical protein
VATVVAVAATRRAAAGFDEHSPIGRHHNAQARARTSMTSKKLNRPAKPGATNALHVLLTFVRVLPGNPFGKLDAEQVFRDMRSELADVVASDLVLAAGLADQIAKQMRSVSWRLRYGKDGPKAAPKPLDKKRLRPIRAGARRFEPNDPRLLACPGVIEQWRQHLGVDREWRVQEVIGCAREVDELRAVLLGVAEGAGGTISAQKLGTWLSQVEGVGCDGASFRCIEGKLYPRWVLIED